MASVNHCIFIGNVGKIETRFMPNGDAVTNISLAVNESWKDKSTGEKKEHTEWVPVTMYRQLAEIAQSYVKVGDPIYLSGAFKTRKWEKDGVTHYKSEIVADTMQMLGSRKSSDEPQRPAQAAKPAQTGGGSSGFDDMADDIPFASCAIEHDVIARRLAGRKLRP